MANAKFSGVGGKVIVSYWGLDSPVLKYAVNDASLRRHIPERDFIGRNRMSAHPIAVIGGGELYFPSSG